MGDFVGAPEIIPMDQVTKIQQEANAQASVASLTLRLVGDEGALHLLQLIILRRPFAPCCRHPSSACAGPPEVPAYWFDVGQRGRLRHLRGLKSRVVEQLSGLTVFLTAFC